MVTPALSLCQYWLYCNTRFYLVRSVSYDSLFGVPEILLQIPHCKRKLTSVRQPYIAIIKCMCV